MLFQSTLVRILLASLLLVSACLACADSYIAKVTVFDGPCVLRPRFVDYLCDKNDYGEGNAQTHQSISQWFHTLQASFVTKDPSVKATLNSWGTIGGMAKRNKGSGNLSNDTVQHTEMDHSYQCVAVQPGSATAFNVRYHW